MKPGHNIAFERQLNDIQLQMEMSVEDHLKLKWLAAEIEASSFGEVIRRALMALEFIEPVFSPHETGEVDGIRTSKRFHTRIPNKTKDRLDRIKQEEGLTYSEVVSHALSVLAQLIVMRKTLLEKGNDHNVLIRSDNSVHPSPANGKENGQVRNRRSRQKSEEFNPDAVFALLA